MRLNAHYVIADDPREQVIPERQPGLAKIPPAERISHPEIRAAIAAFDEAIKVEHEARRTHTQAEQELPAAEFKDEQALADAQSAHRKDPGAVNAEKQAALIRDLKRKHGAAKITLQRAVLAVKEAFEQHGDDWRATLEAERDAIREQMSRSLDEFSELHRRLQVTSANLAIGGSAARAPASFVATVRAPRTGDGNTLHVAEIVEHLKQLGAPQQTKAGVVEDVDPTVLVTQNGNRVVDHKARIERWVDQEAEAAQSHAASEAAADKAAFGSTREARLARAEEARERRMLQRDADRDAVDAVR